MYWLLNDYVLKCTSLYCIVRVEVIFKQNQKYLFQQMFAKAYWWSRSKIAPHIDYQTCVWDQVLNNMD